MSRTVLFVFIIILFSNCSKERQNQQVPEGIWVKIENRSGLKFENASIGTLTNFGDVDNGESTEYKKADEPVYSIMCLLTINDKVIMVGTGICGTPMPPPLSPGFYTMKIKKQLPAGNFDFEISRQ